MCPGGDRLCSKLGMQLLGLGAFWILMASIFAQKATCRAFVQKNINTALAPSCMRYKAEVSETHQF